MALSAQEEAIVKGMIAGLSAAEATALGTAAQERRITELRDEWTRKRAALDTAAGNYLASLDVSLAALKSGVAADITAAKQGIQTAKQALVDALQAAK